MRACVRLNLITIQEHSIVKTLAGNLYLSSSRVHSFFSSSKYSPKT